MLSLFCPKRPAQEQEEVLTEEYQKYIIEADKYIESSLIFLKKGYNEWWEYTLELAKKYEGDHITKLSDLNGLKKEDIKNLGFVAGFFGLYSELIQEYNKDHETLEKENTSFDLDFKSMEITTARFICQHCVLVDEFGIKRHD